MTAVYGWSFLVARGRQQGYQTLLAPDFLAESNEYGVLGELTGGDLEPAIARLHGLSAGDVVLAYRTQRLVDGDLAGGGPVTDEFGRPLELLYGFVVRAESLSHVDEGDFDQARAEAIATYERFLADESAFGLATSQAFTPRSIPAAAEPLQPTPAASAIPAAFAAPQPVQAVRRPPRRSVAVIGLLVIALSAAVWLMLLRGRGPVTDVELAELRADTVDCSAPITIQATITTDAKASVKYHWESTLAKDSETRTLEFPKAAAQTVETTVQPKSTVGALEFSQTLVVEEPNSTDEERRYTLTCK
ncbi:hypothetical protein AB0L70_24990 [Kribbella sp. NPDC051952]|uniref:hypothetical protein n=1 Tax=Kribbella sp. NPDC051952 TaxID=3154851 RepID=UPI003440A438